MDLKFRDKYLYIEMQRGGTERGEAQRRRPCEGRGREWSYVVTGQEMLEVTGNWERQGRGYFPGVSKGAQLC